MVAFLLCLAALVIVVAVIVGIVSLRAHRRPNALEQLGVSSTYPQSCFPAAKIEAYSELKERLRGTYAAKGSSDNDLWMRRLPPEAKDMVKFRLMQRAIGDMAALQKIDADARGYSRLFAKGMVTRQFWNSVVETERELSMELESVKAEAASVEPNQDPQSILSEAMQFVLRYGDTVPAEADIAGSADAISNLVNRPTPGAPAHPRPMAPPPGPAQPQPGGVGDTYTWRQDADEVEVSIDVPVSATKAEVKVHFQARALRVELRGSVLVEGKLAAGCRPEGSTWTLSRGRVVVSLEKADPRQWASLFLTKA